MATSPFKKEVSIPSWPRICSWVGAILVFISCACSNAQTKVEGATDDSHIIRCFIQVERSEWNPTSSALITGKIEYLRDGSSEVNVVPMLHLSSKTSSAMRDRYWAPVDLLHDDSLAVDRQSIAEEVVGIRAKPIQLKFKNKGETITFRIDARNVLWAREISSAGPSQNLFVAVEPGAYELQLVMDTGSGNSQSNKLTITVARSERKKQKP